MNMLVAAYDWTVPILLNAWTEHPGYFVMTVVFLVVFKAAVSTWIPFGAFILCLQTQFAML
jgi:hypothetical protein